MKYKQQKFISYSSEGLELQSQDTDLVSGEAPLPGPLLAVCSLSPQMADGMKELSVVSLMRAQFSWPVTSLRPLLLILSPELGAGHKHSVYSKGNYLLEVIYTLSPQFIVIKNIFYSVQRIYFKICLYHYTVVHCSRGGGEMEEDIEGDKRWWKK